MTIQEYALTQILGTDPFQWKMSYPERIGILGILAALKPKTILEFGCGNGGLTYWLDYYSSEEVVTIDKMPTVLEVAKSLSRTTPLHMTFQEAVDLLTKQGKHFDLTVIDGDHSEKGISRDLKSAIPISDIILLHDTYYPPCRRGIKTALAGLDIYSNLNLIPGTLKFDGLWGGLGIVATKLPRNITFYPGQESDLYPLFRTLSFPYVWIPPIYRFLTKYFRILKYKSGQMARSLLLFNKKKQDPRQG